MAKMPRLRSANGSASATSSSMVASRLGTGLPRRRRGRAVGRTRSRSPRRPRLADDLAHVADLGFGGFAVGGFLAQDVQPQQRVSWRDRHVQLRPGSRHRVQVLGKGLERPGDPGPQRVGRHALGVLRRPGDRLPAGPAGAMPNRRPSRSTTSPAAIAAPGSATAVIRSPWMTTSSAKRRGTAAAPRAVQRG